MYRVCGYFFNILYVHIYIFIYQLAMDHYIHIIQYINVIYLIIYSIQSQLTLTPLNIINNNTLHKLK